MVKSHEEISVYRGANSVSLEAGGGRHEGNRGMPEDGCKEAIHSTTGRRSAVRCGAGCERAQAVVETYGSYGFACPVPGEVWRRKWRLCYERECCGKETHPYGQVPGHTWPLHHESEKPGRIASSGRNTHKDLENKR